MPEYSRYSPRAMDSLGLDSINVKTYGLQFQDLKSALEVRFDERLVKLAWQNEFFDRCHAMCSGAGNLEIFSGRQGVDDDFLHLRMNGDLAEYVTSYIRDNNVKHSVCPDRLSLELETPEDSIRFRMRKGQDTPSPPSYAAGSSNKNRNRLGAFP